MLCAQRTQMPPSGASLPRTIFDYEVIDYIGEGARSAIYVVTEPQTHQLYALKHVRYAIERDQRFFEQLENEYQVSQRFAHPILRRSIALHDNRALLRRATEAALLMELFDGTPLDRQRPTEQLKLLDVFMQVAQGLSSLHGLGYVHCDLKPNNIMVNAEGQVKLIDFGQACKIGAVKERIQGTPDYIAPEQVRCEPLSVRTDVFSFGATMYWALSGRTIPTLYTLKKGENSFLVDARIPSPREIEPAIPEPLSNLVMDCIRTQIQKRPEDMAELLRRMEIIRYTIARRGAAVA